MLSTNTRVVLSGLLLGLLLPLETEAAIIGMLEGPDDGAAAAGVGIIRGWAFSGATGVRISQVNLRIDDSQTIAIPCCSARKDVQSAFPQYPDENTYNSGYGITFNYGNLAAGPHRLVVEIQDSSGVQTQYTHTITVVKPGDFAFIDRVDLTGAQAAKDSQDILLSGLRVRDKASQKVAQVNARLRWFPNIQGLGLVDATTVGMASTPLDMAAPARTAAAPSQAIAEIPHAALESPNSGETGAGIAIIRGWVIAPAGRAIQQVQLLVDGQPTLIIPCCSRRGDVAAAFPNEPNAAQSGFGATFNYGNLAPGVHRLTVAIQDSSGAQRQFTRGILTRRPGNFNFLTQLDFSNATARVAGGELVVAGAVATDKAAGQTARSDLRYRWDGAAQAFVLAEESVDTVTVTNTNCTVNGDTSSLEALSRNSGSDGVSLEEVIQVINKRLGTGGRVAVDFAAGGKIQCSSPTALDPLFGGITINGDTNGDGVPDVVLQNTLLTTAGNDITLRGLSLQSDEIEDSARAQPQISITVPNNGGSSRNVAVLDSVLISKIRGLLSIGLGPKVEWPSVQVAAGEDSELNGVLVSSNEIKAENIWDAAVSVTLDMYTKPLLTKLSRIDIHNNRIDCTSGGGIGLFNRHEKENAIELAANDNVLSTGTATGFSAGAHFWAEEGKTTAGSTLILDVSGNRFIIGQAPYGIHFTGGYRKEEQNHVVHARVVENAIEAGFLTSGVGVSGGEYAGNHNSVLVDIKNNLLRSGFAAGGIVVIGGASGVSNTADAHISGNVISVAKDSYAHGLFLTGGTDDCQDSCQIRDALNNLLTSNITANSIQIEAGNRSDVTVWGASKKDASSIVKDNQALVDITHNSVSHSILCNDNVPGNTAKCTCQDNTAECTATASATSLGQPSLLTPASARFVQQLTGHQSRVMMQEQEFREKAEQTEDQQLHSQYLEIADRFHNLNERLTARIERGW